MGRRPSPLPRQKRRDGPPLRMVHVFCAAVLGALTSRHVMSEDAPEVDPLAECGEAKNDQVGGKEVAVGASSRMKSNSLKRILDRVDNGSVILTFADSRYQDSLLNWLAYAERNGITNYAVVCLDPDMPRWMAERRGACAYQLTNWRHGSWSSAGPNDCSAEGQAPSMQQLPNPNLCKQQCDMGVGCRAITCDPQTKSCYVCGKDYTQRPSTTREMYLKNTKTLWVARWRLLLRLLNMNVHVLMADLDAILLRNPFGILNQHSADADIISQRGSFPQTLSEEWGACVCMGFTYWRATEATKIFTATVNSFISATGDDQVAVNMALKQGDVKWAGIEPPGKLSYQTSTEPSIGVTNKGLRMMLLPHNKFPRVCEDPSVVANAVAAHCFVREKEGGAKMKSAKTLGLWAVRKEWNTIDVSSVASFSEYVELIREDI